MHCIFHELYSATKSNTRKKLSICTLKNSNFVISINTNYKRTKKKNRSR